MRAEGRRHVPVQWRWRLVASRVRPLLHGQAATLTNSRLLPHTASSSVGCEYR